jgi:hypothetical protein
MATTTPQTSADRSRQQGSKKSSNGRRSTFNSDYASNNGTRTLYFDSQDAAHFEKWRLAMVSETTTRYGKLANLFITNQYPPEDPLPTAPTFALTDDNDPGGIQREYIKQLISNKVRDDSQNKKDKPSLFGFILQRLSTASLTQVQRRVIEIVDADREENNLPAQSSKATWSSFLAHADPLDLWTAIR